MEQPLDAHAREKSVENKVPALEGVAFVITTQKSGSVGEKDVTVFALILCYF